MKPPCSVSVDLDGLDCYYRIHGLGEPPPSVRGVVLRECVERFARVFERRGILATFFVIGRDLDPDVESQDPLQAREIVAGLSHAGHEIGNHSYSHHYSMGRASSATVADEIERAHDLIVETTGTAAVGFRAPGYGVSATILQELVRLEYRYDSSILPAPAYYLAKAAAMGAMKLRGRRSEAVLTDARALFAPPDPYRPDLHAPWRRGQAPILEIPIAVTPWMRFPVIGTSLLVAPSWLRSRWINAMRRRPFFNLELHGIDLADAREDEISGTLVARQPDLRIPLQQKMETLEAILDGLIAEFDVKPLREASSTILELSVRNRAPQGADHGEPRRKHPSG